jgi:hypothetical protein
MCTEQQVATLIETHLARYPAAQVGDVYKLLHQATFGPGHAIASRKVTRDWIAREMETLTPARDEALLENVHPAGEIVRVHLRPFMSYDGKPKTLVDAMVSSAKQVAGTIEQMVARWACFEAACQPGATLADRFALRDVQLLGRIRADEGWPAMHHTPAFHEAYRPAYRVLVASEARQLCDTLGAPVEIV